MAALAVQRREVPDRPSGGCATTADPPVCVPAGGLCIRSVGVNHDDVSKCPPVLSRHRSRIQWVYMSPSGLRIQSDQRTRRREQSANRPPPHEAQTIGFACLTAVYTPHQVRQPQTCARNQRAPHRSSHCHEVCRARLTKRKYQAKRAQQESRITINPERAKPSARYCPIALVFSARLARAAP
jgi:hypothetical protein